MRRISRVVWWQSRVVYNSTTAGWGHNRIVAACGDYMCWQLSAAVCCSGVVWQPPMTQQRHSAS